MRNGWGKPRVIETIRPMRREDVGRVYELECMCFRSPWSKAAFTGELKNDVAYYHVLERDGVIGGYAGMWVLFDEAHITNVAVMEPWRGQGCAERLMRAMMASARALGARAMTLEVRENNAPAQRLYQRLDFFQNGYRPGYYADSGEGALILWNRDIRKTLERGGQER